jgi:hypothetical protein
MLRVVSAFIKAKTRFEMGAERARTRRVRAQQSLSVSPPLPAEVHLIHNLYLQSMKQRRMAKQDFDAHEQHMFNMLLSGSEQERKAAAAVAAGTACPTALMLDTHGGDISNNNGSKAGDQMLHKELLSYYKEKQHRENFRWMRDTVYKSAQLMHIQDRNVHGKIFGGYIMNKAFEIAWVAAVRLLSC